MEYVTSNNFFICTQSLYFRAFLKWLTVLRDWLKIIVSLPKDVFLRKESE